jgi:hypothetical protein
MPLYVKRENWALFQKKDVFTNTLCNIGPILKLVKKNILIKRKLV